MARAAIYRPRRPRETALYQCLDDYWEEFRQAYTPLYECLPASPQPGVRRSAPLLEPFRLPGVLRPPGGSRRSSGFGGLVRLYSALQFRRDSTPVRCGQRTDRVPDHEGFDPTDGWSGLDRSGDFPHPGPPPADGPLLRPLFQCLVRLETQTYRDGTVEHGSRRGTATGLARRAFCPATTPQLGPITQEDLRGGPAALSSVRKSDADHCFQGCLLATNI